MQQRQPRLGDILDDYCPRERRVTNHAVVAMIGPEVKQTRCTTCDADHEYKHAKVPRQRRKADAPALLAQAAAAGPKRVRHEPEGAPAPAVADNDPAAAGVSASEVPVGAVAIAEAPPVADSGETGLVSQPDEDTRDAEDAEDGPVHRPLIRATLPRAQGQPPPQRPAPDFTIRQPGGRQNRFRPRHQRGGQPFLGNRSGGNPGGGGGHRQTSGRPPHHQHGHGPVPSRRSRHEGPQGPGHKRSK